MTRAEPKERVEPVHPGDHVRGASKPRVTVIEYGDFDCPHTRRAQGEVDRLMRENDDLRIVFRHFPLRHLHANAELLACVAEAASLQGKYWDMHDHLMHHKAPVDANGLVRDAESIGVDMTALRRSVSEAEIASRVQHDVTRGSASGVHSTPTFFFGDERHEGHYDFDTLAARLAEAREDVTAT